MSSTIRRSWRAGRYRGEHGLPGRVLDDYRLTPLSLDIPFLASNSPPASSSLNCSAELDAWLSDTEYVTTFLALTIGA